MIPGLHGFGIGSMIHGKRTPGAGVRASAATRGKQRRRQANKRASAARRRNR